jgi:hypothetical protein
MQTLPSTPSCLSTRTPISKADETRHVNKRDEAYADFEEKVHRKAMTLVKKKIEQRLKDVLKLMPKQYQN